MEVKTEVKKSLTDSNGREVKPQDVLIMQTRDGHCLAGIFNGITARGSLQFISLVNGKFFCVMPGTITECYHQKLEIEEVNA